MEIPEVLLSDKSVLRSEVGPREEIRGPVKEAWTGRRGGNVPGYRGHLRMLLGRR